MKKTQEEKQNKNKKHDTPTKQNPLKRLTSNEKLFYSIYIIVFLIIFLPTKSIEYQAETIYQDTETYIDVEPYEVEEAYLTKEAYISTETYEDSIPISRDVPYEEDQIYYEKLQETDCDSDSNCFCQKSGIIEGEIKCIECACQRTRSITKYRTEVEYETVEKTRPVTKYKDVEKTRTITKYKDVDKTRTIANVKTETKTKQVNWLFNFIVPWKINIF